MSNPDLDLFVESVTLLKLTAGQVSINSLPTWANERVIVLTLGDLSVTYEADFHTRGIDVRVIPENKYVETGTPRIAAAHLVDHFERRVREASNRELAERFSNQDQTRAAAIQGLIDDAENFDALTGEELQ